MKIFVRKITRIKKRRAIKRAIIADATGLAYKYGRINVNPNLFVNYGQQNQHLEAKYSYQEYATVGDDQHSLIESESINHTRIKLDSGVLGILRKDFQNEIPDYLKKAIQFRSGDLGKSGPGARAKSNARRNARKTGGGSRFAQGFTPQRQYGSWPINEPLSCCKTVGVGNEIIFRNQT